MTGIIAALTKQSTYLGRMTSKKPPKVRVYSQIKARITQRNPVRLVLHLGTQVREEKGPASTHAEKSSHALTDAARYTGLSLNCNLPRMQEIPRISPEKQRIIAQHRTATIPYTRKGMNYFNNTATFKVGNSASN